MVTRTLGLTTIRCHEFGEVDLDEREGRGDTLELGHLVKLRHEIDEFLGVAGDIEHRLPYLSRLHVFVFFIKDHVAKPLDDL